jgi:hypothetical protein
MLAKYMYLMKKTLLFHPHFPIHKHSTPTIAFLTEFPRHLGANRAGTVSEDGCFEEIQKGGRVCQTAAGVARRIEDGAVSVTDRVEGRSLAMAAKQTSVGRGVQAVGPANGRKRHV